MSNQGCNLHSPVRTTTGCLRAAPACTAQGTATVVSFCNLPTPSPTRLTYTYPTCINIPHTTSYRGDCYVTELLSLPSCPTETAGYTSTTLTFVDYFWRNGCLREAPPITVYEVLKWPGERVAPTSPPNPTNQDDTPSRTIAQIISPTLTSLQPSTPPPPTITSTITSTPTTHLDEPSSLPLEKKSANVGLIVGMTATATLLICATVIGVGCWYRKTRYGSPSGQKGRDTPQVPEYRAELVREVPKAHQ